MLNIAKCEQARDYSRILRNTQKTARKFLTLFALLPVNSCNKKRYIGRRIYMTTGPEPATAGTLWLV
jgi:hypothetical protein